MYYGKRKRSETISGTECNTAICYSIAGQLMRAREEIKSFNAYFDNLQSHVYELIEY